MYDAQTINASTDLLALLRAEETMTRAAAGEYAGPCPKCGGKDRLHVTATWWFCRQCHPLRGDAVGYVMWRYGLRFPDACERLGGDKEALDGRGLKNAPRSTPNTPAPLESEAPSAQWQARAHEFVTYAKVQLWQDEAALAYLRERGLSDKTIWAARLGYNPKSLYDAGERWGQEARVWLPRGWVIPCAAAESLWYVKVRRPAEDLEGQADKYIAIRGSRKAGVLYGLDGLAGHSDVILAEGEINALTLRQCVCDVCAVVSVGDAGNRPGTQAMRALGNVRRWWLAYDHDQAGAHGQEALAKLYPRARALSWPWGERDVNDAHRDGEDLAVWVFGQIGPGEREARDAWFEARLQPFLTDGRIQEGDARYRVGAALLSAWEAA